METRMEREFLMMTCMERESLANPFLKRMRMPETC